MMMLPERNLYACLGEGASAIYEGNMGKQMWGGIIWLVFTGHCLLEESVNMQQNSCEASWKTAEQISGQRWWVVAMTVTSSTECNFADKKLSKKWARSLLVIIWKKWSQILLKLGSQTPYYFFLRYESKYMDQHKLDWISAKNWS